MAINGGFDITSILNVESLQQAKQRRKKISYKLLIPNENNHYSLEGIDELADSIEDLGILQDVLVKPLDNGHYKIVGGHRRREAVRILVEVRGLTDFEQMDCVLLDADEDDTVTQIKLHISNTTARELSEYDKMQAISQLKRLIKEANEKGLKMKGKVRDIIAGQMNLGTTQVQKYLNIDEQAPDTTKQALKNGDITVEDAYAITRRKKQDIKSKPTIKEIIEKFAAFKKASEDLRNPSLATLIGQIEKQLDEISKGVSH